MVSVACVKVGAKYPDAYVITLRNMVARRAPGVDFVCYCDKPVDGVRCELLTEGLPGWWSKIELFKLRQPMLYMDLDVVVVGNLRPLLEWDGFGIMKDPWLSGYGSGIMRLTGNEGHVWEKFRPGIMSMIRGDQDWLNIVMPDAKTFPPEWVPFYKAHQCFGPSPPENALVVNMHGWPKPHQISSGWVPQYWR